MVHAVFCTPVSLADMLAEANDPKSYARLSPVRAGWFIGRLRDSIANDRDSIAFLQRHGLDDDPVAISKKWMKIHRAEAAVALLATVKEG